MQIKFSTNDHGNPPGKLADAEIHFITGPLEGLKLIGFAVWQRRNGAGRNVTFPCRSYSVNGERRSFALLRPLVDGAAQDRIRDLILQAYDEDVERAAHRAAPPAPIVIDGSTARATLDNFAGARQDAGWDAPTTSPAPQQTPIDF